MVALGPPARGGVYSRGSRCGLTTQADAKLAYCSHPCFAKKRNSRQIRVTLPAGIGSTQLGWAGWNLCWMWSDCAFSFSVKLGCRMELEDDDVESCECDGWVLKGGNKKWGEERL